MADLRDFLKMTRRQREILEIMARHQDDEDGELVYERGRGFLGEEPVAARTVFSLLRLCAISLQRDSVVGGFERYRINERGRGYLEKVERVETARPLNAPGE